MCRKNFVEKFGGSIAKVSATQHEGQNKPMSDLKRLCELWGLNFLLDIRAVADI